MAKSVPNPVSNAPSIPLTGNACHDGVVPLIVILLSVCAILVTGHLIMRAERDKKKYPSRTKQPSQKLVSDGLGAWLEDFLVTPFVPASLEAFAGFLYAFAFLQTITMAFTRVYQSQWKLQFVAQQYLPNEIAYLMGCERMDGGDVTAITYPLDAEANDYTMQTTDPNNPHAEDLGYENNIDFAIGFHLSCGILWLSAGAFQIIMARYGWSYNESIRHKAHKYFGYFSTILFSFHMLGASNILLRQNPAHHVPLIRAALFSDVTVSTIFVVGGIMFQRGYMVEKSNAMHQVMMAYGFIQSIEGSGTIRFTTWYIWVFAKFLPYVLCFCVFSRHKGRASLLLMRLSALGSHVLLHNEKLHSEDLSYWVDSTKCQQRAINGYDDISPTYMASAAHCWYSYMIRLFLMRILTIYIKWIFMRLPHNEGLKHARSLLVDELKVELTALAVFLVIGPIIALHLPEWLSDLLAENIVVRTIVALILTTIMYIGLTFTRVRALYDAMKDDLAEQSKQKKQ